MAKNPSNDDAENEDRLILRFVQKTESRAPIPLKPLADMIGSNPEPDTEDDRPESLPFLPPPKRSQRVMQVEARVFHAIDEVSAKADDREATIASVLQSDRAVIERQHVADERLILVLTCFSAKGYRIVECVVEEVELTPAKN